MIEDIVVLIVSFAVKREPSTFTKLRIINKHWYQSLNPNKLDVNLIWEKNITRELFPYVSPKLKVKRWDRFCQY